MATLSFSRNWSVSSFSDEENKIGGGQVVYGDFFSLQSNVDEFMLWIPGAIGHFGIDAERVFVYWLGIVVIEIVDHLFYPHGAGGRQAAIVDVAADIAVGGFVDIDGKSRQRVLCGGEELVFDDVGVFFCVGAFFYWGHFIGHAVFICFHFFSVF